MEFPQNIDYVARVERGIDLLDEQWSVWWTEDEGINLDVLDVSHGRRCVTAQAAQRNNVGSYWTDGAKLFGLTMGNGGTYISHGFNIDSPYDSLGDTREGWEDYSEEEAYNTLNALWREAILTRREATQSK